MIDKKKLKKEVKVINKKKWKWVLIILSSLLVSVTIIIVLLKNRKPVFDGNKAFSQLIKQVEFGPRICGTTGHEKTKEYLITQLKQYADLVSEQTFNYTDKHDSTKVYHGVNIVASFNTSADVKRILFCAHWDSRPFADNDPDTINHKLPVPAANDGASGVAVLLEMARLFSENKPKVGVDIVFFDLEDIGDNMESSNSLSPINPFGIGSEMFVKNNPDYFPEFGILLDMVGDKQLRIPKESFSVQRANDIVEKIWSAASVVGAKAFVNENGGAVDDDHIAFLKKSIPVVDLIHLPFPKTWHTIHDIPENCSSSSLQQIGNVLVEVIYNEK
jgi:Zn-dependent M28 family amino/carboxypeptidase